MPTESARSRVRDYLGNEVRDHPGTRVRLRRNRHEAGENPRKLLNLRNRMARIRVFDPACGSGNFLVIAYKEMRAIEAEINKRRGEAERATDIPKTNFRGIELRSFPAEIARLALIIAEYQADVLYRGPKMALAEFLPLDSENWITCGNALRLDWLKLMDADGKGVKFHSDDLFSTPLDQAHINFENEGGETYICGNPPYLGSKRQTEQQKSDIHLVLGHITDAWKSLDYVAPWFIKASDFAARTHADTAFVSTNSICQGQQAAIIWPIIFNRGQEIIFSHKSFSWQNLASNNAGVTVVVVGFGQKRLGKKIIFENDSSKGGIIRSVDAINAYLIPGAPVFVEPRRSQISQLPEFDRGNSPTDGGYLLLERGEANAALIESPGISRYLRPFFGSAELIRGVGRVCIWVNDDEIEKAQAIPFIQSRISKVREFRTASAKAATRKAAAWPHRFDERKPLPHLPIICVPITSSENREFLPADIIKEQSAISNLAFSMPSERIWVFSLIASKMLLTWVATVCSRMRTDYRFTNTLCWNTFPVPTLTEKNKADLTRCAEDILLAREAHFPATIADLYDPETMPADLRAAHEHNDEVLERIYIGRRFKNDTERLEKLFELYTRMTAAQGVTTKPTKARASA